MKDSGKRGLAYNDPEYTNFFSLEGQNSLVSWCYNWNYEEDNPSELNPDLMYIPMLWSNAADLEAAWPAAAQAAIDNGADALMSFNEPDWCGSGSACMSVNASVTAYQAYMQPFADSALIGAPAVTNAGAPYGLTWLGYFMGNCTGCTFDFIALHWYSNHYAGATYFYEYIEEARVVADGRPIWITEFGLDGTDDQTDAELQAFLEEVLPWMDAQEDITRYAYFGDFEGYLLNSAGTALSADGVIYNNYTNVTTTMTSSTSTSLTSSSTSTSLTTTSTSTS